jgi:chaperone BCS1
LKDFIMMCKAFKKEQSKGRTMTYTFSSSGGGGGGYDNRGNWGQPYAAPSRDLATVELDTEIKNSIVKDIARYLDPKTAEFYKNNGIPYRRGYLLHGPPGTGKSSLSKALASNFNLALYCMNLGEEGIGDRDLRSAFAGLPTKCIVLLEDIDSTGIGREKPVESQEEKDSIKDAALAGLLPDGINEFDFDMLSRGRSMARITLSGLLNALDGASASEGRIVIMTSNHPEVLDGALIRPGRVDKRILLPDMSRTSASKIFARMYSHTSIQNLTALAEVFASRLPDGKVTPAELQGFILDRMDEPEQAVDEVEAWSAQVIREKEQEKEKREARQEARDVAKAFKAKRKETEAVTVGASRSDEVLENVNDAKDADNANGFASHENVASTGDRGGRGGRGRMGFRGGGRGAGRQDHGGVNGF